MISRSPNLVSLDKQMKIDLNMKHWVCLTIFLASSLLAAGSSPQEDVLAAIAALGTQTNYSWKTTVQLGLLHSATTRYGRTVKDGYTLFSTNPANDQGIPDSFAVLIRGTNAAVQTAPNSWRSAADVLRDPGSRSTPAWALAQTAQNLKPPAILAANLAAQAQDWLAGTNSLAGVLNAESVTSLLGDRLPISTNRLVRVTFWITDGKLAKFQWHATGMTTFNGSSRNMDRTATTEIMSVNTTKLQVPDEARKILE
jgi:hypothetical protein